LGVRAGGHGATLAGTTRSPLLAMIWRLKFHWIIR